MMLPLIAMPGASEILLILLIVVLLFGAKKLPELARGSGRALRIFKAETKGLMDDDDEDADASKKTPEQLEIDAAAVREAEQRRAREEHNGPTAG
ncbi:MAG: twin-arginine translocase TatA/TatE family subunit [Nocardioides sp.]